MRMTRIKQLTKKSKKHKFYISFVIKNRNIQNQLSPNQIIRLEENLTLRFTKSLLFLMQYFPISKKNKH